jgi:methylglutaconyl-CoA hydratase
LGASRHGYDAPVSDRLRIERGGTEVVPGGAGGSVVRVTLARPEVHNAFDASLIAELRAVFAGLAREGPTELRAVVLAGDGPSFCAGADIAWMRAALTLDREANEQDAMAMAEMFDAIDTCPVPVIARVHGSALGGGMGLCAVADLVLAESGTKFGVTETRLGILPAVIAPFVIAKIGETHARALFPAGRRFDAVRAMRIGLVHEVVEGLAALDAAVDTAVADLLAAGPTAARAAKAIVREVRGLPHGSSKWHTARVIAGQRQTAEAQEGFRAFEEKRRPAWAPSEDG